MTQIIANDAILSDVIESLSNPEEYVRRLLENMLLCKKKNGTAYLRLGVLGTGQIPNYRIEFLGKSGEATASFTGKQETEIVFGAFNGRSHAEMVGVGEYDLDKLFSDEDKPERVLQYGHWSEKVVSVEDVQSILGKIRNFRKRK